jgi:hypothetical protein
MISDRHQFFELVDQSRLIVRSPDSDPLELDMFRHVEQWVR